MRLARIVLWHAISPPQPNASLVHIHTITQLLRSCLTVGYSRLNNCLCLNGFPRPPDVAPKSRRLLDQFTIPLNSRLQTLYTRTELRKAVAVHADTRFLPPLESRHLVVLSILCFLIHLAQAPMLPSGAQWFAEFCFFLSPVRHLHPLLLKVGKVEVQAD